MQLGEHVIYRLSAEDAAQINRRRTDGPSISDRIREGEWPLGAQAHIGSHVSAGIDFPMIVVRFRDAGDGKFIVNGQLFLDGSDSFWVKNAAEGDAPGMYHFPY
jgi:hypothetical protein